MKDLRNKVAVVTGAASGVGLGLALRFAQEGMKVVLADVEDEALRGAVQSVRAEGSEAIGVWTDVRSAEGVQHLADVTLETFGSVHVVCNNAGVETGGLFTDIPLDSWKWVLDVNLYGVLHGCRTFLPLMREQGEGHIVNTGSGASFFAGLPTFAPYITSKFAVLGLTESLDMELRAAGDDVRMSFLAPIARTRMPDAERNRPEDVPGVAADPTRQRVMEAIRANNELGLDPSDVADMVVQAIHNERFFVIVQPEMTIDALEQRIAWIRDNKPVQQLEL